MAKLNSGAGESRDQALLDSKRKITEMVRLKFARFGDDALAIILAYALQPVRLPILLERLELRISSQDLDVRLDAVSQWILDNGPIHFKIRALAERKSAVKPIDLGPMPADIPDMGESTAPPGPAPTPVAPPPPPQPDKPAPQAEPSGPMVKVAGYEGPERRAGKERRADPDRRARLNAINNNKRFGGDRRKNPKGRRKDDQARPDFWWRHLAYDPPGGNR